MSQGGYYLYAFGLGTITLFGRSQGVDRQLSFSLQALRRSLSNAFWNGGLKGQSPSIEANRGCH
jgi:hypothetical protein